MLPGLTRDEILRYSRHLLIPEVGLEGQRKLKAASVLIVGTGGLEFFGEIALLRSVAVDASHRGKKIGEKIYSQLISNAKASGVRNLYLLTTDANGYFERFGFKEIDRSTAPEAIQTHGQFTELCPDSAIIMQKTL